MSAGLVSPETSLACRWPPSRCVLTWLCSGFVSSSYKDTSHIGLRLHPYLTLITSLKALFPNIVTLRVRASTYGFGGNTIQFITNSEKWKQPRGPESKILYSLTSDEADLYLLTWKAATIHDIFFFWSHPAG